MTLSKPAKTCIIVILMWVVCADGSKLTAEVIEVGDFIDHVETLRDLTFASGSGLYVAPTAGQQTSFATLAATLLSGDTAAADTQATALDYELVQFTDNVSGNTYYGLREENNTPTRGWGSYYVNLNATKENLIEAPHPRFDTNSWEIAGRIFRDSDSRGFLMAGAHRNANGQGTADVAHLANSIFQEVHEAWTGQAGERTTWSIHGFDDANHAFPAGTDAVISNGDGSVSSEIVALDARFTEQGFVSHAYNTLDVADPLNVAVNGNESGATFASLGGTTNVQGVHTRSLGGTFVHVEMEQSIRFDANNRVLAATALTSAMEDAAVPEPHSWALLLLAVLSAHRWGRSGTSVGRQR